MKKFFQELKIQFLNDYRTSALTIWLECIGTLACLLASISLALYGDMVNMIFLMSFYLTGSLCWMVASKRRNNSFCLFLNVCYVAVNMVGLVRALNF